MLTKLSARWLLGCIVLVAPLHAVAQQAEKAPSSYPPHWYGPGPWHGHGTHLWWICPLVMLILFLVFAAIFVYFRRPWGEHRHHWGGPWHMMEGPGGAATQSALQILNERLAKGEIQKEEYEDKKAAILSSGRH